MCVNPVLFKVLETGYFVAAAFLLGFSRAVVRALTGDLAFTWRAKLTTKWLRRVLVRRGEVRFLGLPITFYCS